MERTETRLRNARVSLYKELPFFGYLVNYATFVEAGDYVPTAAIDKYGNIYYNPDFIRGLTSDQVKGLLAHEVMHVAMEGHMRQGGRQPKLWNIAQDIIINHILTEADMSLPEEGIIPEDGEYQFGDAEFEDLDEHSFETTYAEIMDANDIPENPCFDLHIIDPDGDDECKRDGQLPGIGVNGREEVEVTPEEIEDADTTEKDWSNIMEKAQAADDIGGGEQRGENPAGVAAGRISARGEGTVDYERFIKQTISSAIPNDYDYTKPNKRSRAVGVYLPSIRREHEQVEVAVLLDTSGSISDDQLRDFASEMVEIVETFDAVNLTLIQHDAEVQGEERYERVSRADVEEIDIVGRGGTDHRPPLRHLDGEDIDADLVVSYTDGYSAFPNDPPVQSAYLWVLPVSSTRSPEDFPFGSVSRLDSQ